MASFLLITDVSRSHPAVTWTGLVTDTSTRVVEEELGTHGVLITGLLFFPAGTAFILIAEVSRLLVGWSGLFWTALSLQLPRTDRVLTGVLEQLLPAETLLLGRVRVASSRSDVILPRCPESTFSPAC